MIDICVYLDKGSYHSQNDDRALVQGTVYRFGSFMGNLNEDSILLAVADGVGGNPCGYLAAQTVMNAISNLTGNNRLANASESLQEAVCIATEKIKYMAEKNHERKGMATTLTGVYVENQSLMTFHIGNSRAYRFRNDYLYQFTRDDSVVQEMIDLEIIDQSQRNTHKDSHVLTKCIGDFEVVENITIDKLQAKFEIGDALFLCTDGLSDHLEIDEMECILADSTTALDEKCKELMLQARSKGSQDDISIILAIKRDNTEGVK